LSGTAYSDITHPLAVLDAIIEFDEIGCDAFLADAHRPSSNTLQQALWPRTDQRAPVARPTTHSRRYVDRLD
jgi:hypothetical protein